MLLWIGQREGGVLLQHWSGLQTDKKKEKKFGKYTLC